jgi:nucleoside-diphosphate-sugar epimerase
MSKPRISLVTGATGFIGSKVARGLLRDGFAVRAVSTGANRDRLAGLEQKIEWFGTSEVDLLKAAQDVSQFFNFAVVYDRANISSELIHEVNVMLPLRVLNALRSCSSRVACVLGDSFYRKFPSTATAQVRYTESKNQLTRCISDLPADHPCQVALFLIEQVYGPGENLEKAFPRVIRQLLRHTPRVALTAGTQRRDLIHVDDTVEAALLVGRSKWTGVAEVECGSGESTPVKDIFESLKAFSGSRSSLGFGDLPADQTIDDSAADTVWLRKRGWRPRWALEEGLQDFVVDVKRRSEVERM